MRLIIALVFLCLVMALTAAAQTGQELSADEKTVRAAGLGTDTASLLEFFQERCRSLSDGDKLLALARKLGDADAEIQAKASGQLVSAGPAAIPALRHVTNDLENVEAADRARRCLEWLEGSRRGDVPVAAARLLAERKPAGAVKLLLAYLPVADDAAVIEGVKSALAKLAVSAGKPDPDLLKSLHDPLPLRRAVAVEVLCQANHPAVLADARKLLGDTNVQVRLQAALAFARRDDAEALSALIGLLADLPARQRQLAEEPLLQLAGDWAPKVADHDKASGAARRDAWAEWWRKTEGSALLEEFRKRTLSEEDVATIMALIGKLGDKVFANRERAAAGLVAMGSKVIPLLREATRSPDLERSQRAQNCLKQIAKTAEQQRLPPTAARLVALRKPAGASEVLLAYVPFTEDLAMHAEIGKALKNLAIAAGAPDPVLLRSLDDSLSLRRAFAAEALAAAGAKEHFPALRKLLNDPDPQVRLRVVVALTLARDKQAIPALIDLVAELPRGQAWEAEELLTRLAGANAPKTASGDDAASRKLFSEEWKAWWKKNGATVDLALLNDAPMTLGYTLVVELVGGPGVKAVPIGGKVGAKGADRVFELDRSGKVRWQIDDLNNPVDACIVAGDHVLIAEYAGATFSERNLKGNIIWQVSPGGPCLNVQRLANGNTFLAATTGLMEVDRTGKTLSKVQAPVAIRAAYKLPNGQMVCLANSMCVRLDANGAEIKRFPMKNNSYAGAIDVTSKGTVLVPQMDNTVAEYDFDGKIVWQIQAITPGSVTRLTNGHTLVAYSNDGKVVEMDSTGRVLWDYKAPPGNRPFRARQR